MRDNRTEHSISGLFTALLIGLFVLCGLLLILLGARVYANVTERAEQNGNDRILSAYVRGVIRGADCAGNLQVGEKAGIPVLMLAYAAGDAEEEDGAAEEAADPEEAFEEDAEEEEEEDAYVTYMYCYEGYLRELFTSADADFEPENGERVSKAGSFLPSLEDGLLTVRITDADGTESVLSAALRTGERQRKVGDE